jgi:uncharacterized protein YqeY
MQMLALLRKSANAGRSASEEFKSAGRQDLADKEDSQIKILEEYAGSVEKLGEEQIRTTVQGVVDTMRSEGSKVQMGEVLKKVFAPEVLGNKPVEKGEVATILKQILAQP